MLGALLYLRLTSLKNWVLWRVRRLRKPKYLVGAVVGVAYFYFFFFRPLGSHRHLPVHHGVTVVDPAQLVTGAQWEPVAFAIGTTALLVVLAFMWVVPTGRAALGFSEAEIAFLFPAPVTRRALVHFRLLSAQARSLGGGIIMALISNRWSFLGGNALTHALGWWFVFSVLNLHFSGAGFTLTRLGDRGLNVPVRRSLVLALLVAVVALTFWRLAPGARLPTIGGSPDARSFSEWAVGVADTAPLCWVLFPLRLVLAPFLAADTRAFLIAVGPALVVIVLHYLWVVQAAVSFEDATIEQAQRRALRVAGWRSGERRVGSAPPRRRSDPFRLAGAGRPEIAFAWKNLLSTWPYFTPRVFGWTALVLAAASSWARSRPQWAGLAAGAGLFAPFAGAYVLIIGPQFARQDLRHDLAKVEILKTYPVRGWQVVLGELLTPAAILTGILWLALLVTALNLDLHRSATWLTFGWRVGLTAAIASVIPLLVLLQLLVPNAAALLFPGWFNAGRSRGGGIDVMGQRMIFFFAQLLTIVVVLIPAAFAAGLLGVIAQWLLGLPTAVAIATAAVLAVLVGEIAAGLWWLGRRFEKMDVSDEIHAE